jgi:hypothetical protein
MEYKIDLVAMTFGTPGYSLTRHWCGVGSSTTHQERIQMKRKIIAKFQ